MLIRVIEKSSQNEVYRYHADSVVHWPAYPVEDYLYEEVIIPEIPVTPTVKVWEPPFNFMREFTGAERAAIRLAAKTDVVIEDFLDLCKVAPSIMSNDPDLQAAMNYFVALGLLTAERKEEIING